MTQGALDTAVSSRFRPLRVRRKPRAGRIAKGAGGAGLFVDDGQGLGEDPLVARAARSEVVAPLSTAPRVSS